MMNKVIKTHIHHRLCEHDSKRIFIIDDNSCFLDDYYHSKKKLSGIRKKAKIQTFGLNLVSAWECKIDVFRSVILKRNFISYSDFAIIDFRGRFDKQYGIDNFKVYAKHIYRGFSRVLIQWWNCIFWNQWPKKSFDK